MHQRQTSTESLASVFGQALAILQGQPQPQQQQQPQDEQQQAHPPQAHPGGGRPSPRTSGSRRRRQLSRDEEEYARKEREARSIAVEKAYVHDVYEQISQHVSEARYRAWPRVKQFLLELEPGSIVCDVGCGGGKYLNVNPNVFIIGSDRCKSLAHMARGKDHEIVQCDALSLPFGDDTADAVLSIAVIHHVATVERRLKALRELARVLRVGGRVMISVWAMEQRHRKFESQDVLIPWHRPSAPSASNPETNAAAASGSSAASASAGTSGTGVGGKNDDDEDEEEEEEEEEDVYLASGRRGGAGRGCGRAGGSSFSTTCTSEDDVTHYHAYTQTSDSSAGAGSHARLHLRRRGRHRVRGGRSIDPAALEAGLAFQPYHSSSDLSSPNETCYSFFRRAIEKFSTSRRLGESSSLPARVPWFSLGSLEHSALVNFDQHAHAHQPQAEDEAGEALPRDDSQESSESVGDIPIELPQLEAEDVYEGGETEEEEEDRACEITGKESNAPMRTIASNLIAFFWGLESKSKSLDDLTTCQEESGARGRSLKILGRASTLDESHRAHCDDPGLAKYFELQPQHGSATSLSSARSTRSNLSAKSESAKEQHARPRTTHLQQLRTAPSSMLPSDLFSTQAAPVRRHLGSRSWESEPHLLTIQAQGAGRTATTRIRTLSEQGKPSAQTARSHAQVHQQEKSKAMLVVESKLMKAIKEVNESDLSENSTPLNSPAPPSLILSSLVNDGSPSQTPRAVVTPEAAARMQASTSQSQSPRPQLVKQKQSFQFPERRVGVAKAAVGGAVAAASRADVREALVDVASAERLSEQPPSTREKTGCELSAAASAVSAAEAARSAVWAASGCPLGPSEAGAFGRQREYDASSQQGRRRNEAELHSGGLKTPRSAPPVITLDREEASPEVRLTRGVLKQTSFNDELLSRERMRSNEYVRKTIQKQQSLPTESTRRTRSLREGLAAVGKQFELLRAGWSSLRSHQGARTEKTIPEEEEDGAQMSPGGPALRPADGGQQAHGVASGIAARFWQSWGRTSAGDSFTHKRGVLIQPLDVRGRCEAHGLDGAARRSMFQRRRGGSSPLSPSCQPQQQQLDALDNQLASSPSLRRCCMECPGGEIIVVERERKISRGEASDSSSKDGSIQSDTSLDSEDSCVSVIFVPHPEVRSSVGDDGASNVGTPVPASMAKKQRSTSNSSESSESAHSAGSGRGSPLLSPAGHRQGSPVKSAVGAKAVFIKMAPPSRALISGNSGVVVKEDPSDGGYPVLESIEENQPESETETEEARSIKEATAECSVPKKEAKAVRSATISSPTNGVKKTPAAKIARPVRSASLPKSYELEDLPDDPALPVRLPALAPAHAPPLSAGPSRSRGSRFEYPIVRHHPLFAKQVRGGQNLSSLLLGENVRVIRKTLCRPEDVDQAETKVERGPKDPFAATRMRSFEIFNPETDDLDSDSTSDESEESQDSNDSVESVVSARVDDSAKSQDAQQSTGPPTVIVTEAATAQVGPEAISNKALPGEKLKKRVEERRKVLKSLLEENETVLTKFLSKEAAEARRKTSNQTTSESGSESRKENSTENRSELKMAIKAASHITSQLNVDSGKPTRRRLDKARSVSPSSSSLSSGVKQAVARQSSVPLQIEAGNRRQSGFNSPFKEPSALDKERKVTLAQLEVSPSVSEESGAIRSSRESLSGVSVESFPSDISKKSKSPSPCKSDTSFELSPKRADDATVLHLAKTSEALQGCRDADDRSSSGSGRSSSSAGSGQRGGGGGRGFSSTGAIPKRRMPAAAAEEGEAHSRLPQERPIDAEELRGKAAGCEDPVSLQQMTDSTISSQDGRDESISKQMGELESRFGGHNSQSDSESTCGFPYRRLDRRRPGREDSIDSSSTSAKSSVQYSDTSSLLSHRFSTVSISSNVSSEVSFGNTSGSSCYLASMSSADFDDRPALASSLSLSEADEELELDAKQKLQMQHSIKSVDFPISRPPLERLKLKSLFRKSGPFSGTYSAKGDSASPAPGPGSAQSSLTSASAVAEGASVGSPALARGDRKPRSRIGTETSLDTSIDPTTCIDRSSFEEEIFVCMPRDESEAGNASMSAAAAARHSMLSTATSQDSDESDDGGSLTHHRYYHVFREGELDYLINKYVENLHIVSSYYDHTSWCVVAEKVNVWTI